MSNSFCLLFLAALVLSCHGDDFNGYFYPKPSCPLAPPVTVTQTQFQTQYQTATVQVPVYYTSTVTEQQLITSYDTVISTAVQYLTATSTIFITPTPVTVFSTLISTATVCASEAESGIGSVASKPDNSYLPPPSGQVSSEASAAAEPSNGYLPPPTLPDINNGNVPTGPSAAGPTGRSLNFNSFGFNFARAPFSLQLGALPPRA